MNEIKADRSQKNTVPLNIKGEWAIILGGSSGLGLASAKKLASEGFNICIVHRDRKSSLPHIAEEVKTIKSFGVLVKTFNRDALSKEARNEIVQQLPKNSVKLLLHSIAKGSLKKMTGTESETLSKIDLDITIHAMATSWHEWTQVLIQQEKFTANARNIAFTSEGSNRVWPGYGAVSAAKSVLESLMRNMAVELAALGITTNCIQAGTTQTASFRAIPDSEELAKMAINRNPFNRLTTPDDVANVVALLCNNEANWINGSIIKVDGGESLR
ncbi:SDR family oxidoreductase [Aequorivita viscosa]|uniref:NAD(P)-dependent dehydrogenase, short-chain alcohol dehydrogenase family n=1 Tax=Aequorivita viscosa TaxID=797419 RepID=A0A1M6GEW5_9FLAO|nr:SDR family oxidoreductase [Aequorivita viscosa]SDW85322.1 NAD(P)-dependent dehydrogenase, short-chain alcohol dehydrogenase family [Aequorivita viscosa]SHJ08393.1 NAD(P)-dependent dehydrogenase, short-chain alcohol dehydrogenase family [Aequorivita viscosa]